MKVFAESVGTAPAWAVGSALAVGCLVLGAGWWHTHRHGPSVVLPGLRAASVLDDHRNDATYAQAVAERFVSEYFNYSWHGHLLAKRRAAWWCRPLVGQFLLRQSMKRDEFYRRLHLVSNGRLEGAEVSWQDPASDRYVVGCVVEVNEWTGHVRTTSRLKGTIHVRAKQEPDDRPFRMEVAIYDFEPLGAAQVTTEAVAEGGDLPEMPAAVPASTPATETTTTQQRQPALSAGRIGE